MQISTGYRLDLFAPVYTAGASDQEDGTIREVLDLHRLFLENREEIQNRIDNRSNYTTPPPRTATITPNIWRPPTKRPFWPCRNPFTTIPPSPFAMN